MKNDFVSAFDPRLNEVKPKTRLCSAYQEIKDENEHMFDMCKDNEQREKRKMRFISG